MLFRSGPDIDPITVLPKHDILKILEPDMGMVESEYILNNPKMFQMFSDTKAYIPKIIAGSVLGGTAATLTPNDAEAGVKPPTKVTDLVKLLNTSTRHESGFKRLANKPINLTYKGQSNPYTVVDVLKRKGDNYVVLVKDSEGRRLQVPMTKDYFSAFLGAQGTEDYLKLFNNQGAKGQEFMSTKSLGIREAKRSADDFSLS